MSINIHTRNGRNISDSAKSKIVSSYNSGRTVAYICKKYGIKKHTVRHVLLYSGISLGRDVKRPSVTNTEVNDLINEFKKGARIKELCLKYNLSISGVCKILHRNDIPLRYDGKEISKSVMRTIDMCNEGKTITEICKEVMKKRTTVRTMLRYHGLKAKIEPFRRRKHSVNDDYFSVIDSQEKAYFLGLLFADGNVSSSSHNINIYLQERDGYLISKFKKCMGYTGPISKRISKSENHSNQIYIQVNSKKIKDDLAKLGCLPRKARILQFPGIDAMFFWSFFRGYFDGDGCITVQVSKRGAVSKRLIISSCVYFNLELKRILLSKYNIKSSFSRNSGMCSSVTISRKDCIDKIFKLMYKNATIFMKRKKNKFYSHG